MEHLYFFAANMLVFVIVIWFDRKIWKTYALLGVFSLLTSFIFENTMAFAGLWTYHSEPRVLLFSMYVWLLYVPFVCWAFFAARRLSHV